MSYCISCGTPLEESAKFCPKCGTKVLRPGDPVSPPPNAVSGGTETGVLAKKIFTDVTAQINKISGGTGSSIAKLSDLFTDVFRKHDKSESESIFICGTETTTPKPEEIGSDHAKPWLYSRVLVVFAAAFLLLHLCVKLFDNLFVLPGIMFIGSLMIPMTLVVMFFEMNIMKNISFFTVIKIFLLGGCMSLLFTLMLYQLIDLDTSGYFGAILIGIIEEIGKLGIVYLILKDKKNSANLFNGLLVGAAVGAGFATFESAGYAFVQIMESGYNGMVDLILLRGVLSPGGHVIWAAISGYAILLAKGEAELSFSVFKSSAFWKLFCLPVCMHAVWDMPIQFGSEFCLIQLILTVISWVVALVLIKNGYLDIGKRCAAARIAARRDTVPEPESKPIAVEEPVC